MPLWLPLALLGVVVALPLVAMAVPAARPATFIALWVLGIGMLAAGAWIGLSWAPPDREMGDVQRIMYVHVPAVWMALIGLTVNFACSVAYLMKASWKTDAWAEAGAEVGVLFGAFGTLLGAIWGKPTWGVYWTWDPRLTTAAIAIVIYMGYLALRRFVDDSEKRATWSAVVGIIAFVDVPIIWYSVRWWRSLHQIQSTPKTVDPLMTFALRWGAVTFLCFFLAFLWQRYRLAMLQRESELAPPERPPLTQPPVAAR
jgi:heme exporter protein C